MQQEKIHRTQIGLEELVIPATHSTDNLGPEGNWTFYNPEDPYKMISSLHKAFSKLRADIPGETATFLDCGSGNGVAAQVAYFAGFNGANGIEKSRKLAGNAYERLYSSVNKKIIPNDAVHFAHGSYYRHDILPDIGDRCEKELLKMFDVENVNGAKFADYVRAVLDINQHMSVEKLITKYIFPNNIDAFNKLEIVNEKKLTADVIYIYPSDIFFECAFLPQMAFFMKKKSLLSILGPVDDCITTSLPGLRGKEFILLPDCSDIAMCLQIFQKD